VIVTRDECVVCGVSIAERVVSQVDCSVRFKPNCKDGDLAGSGKEIAFIEGRAAPILRAERTMLNFLSFLSGIATQTKRFVDKAKPYGVKLLDTRKTLPLLRYLEKYAVSVGGGYNHRMGLYDQVLIKDNHIHVARTASQIQKRRASTGIKELIGLARRRAPRGTRIEVEVTNIEEFNAAITARPDIIMLDNMRVADVRACVEIRKFSTHKPLLEVSGGITLENVEGYVRCAVDMISVGSLTSSVKPIDMSLDIV
jgi:nicotinate-nucleotide pyrophosphorylase (carboxylating)